jgi:hypothetical protein
MSRDLFFILYPSDGILKALNAQSTFKCAKSI